MTTAGALQPISIEVHDVRTEETGGNSFEPENCRKDTFATEKRAAARAARQPPALRNRRSCGQPVHMEHCDPAKKTLGRSPSRASLPAETCGARGEAELPARVRCQGHRGGVRPTSRCVSRQRCLSQTADLGEGADELGQDARHDVAKIGW